MIEVNTIKETCPHFKKITDQNGHWEGDNYCGYFMEVKKVYEKFMTVYKGSCEDFEKCKFKEVKNDY